MMIGGTDDLRQRDARRGATVWIGRIGVLLAVCGCAPREGGSAPAPGAAPPPAVVERPPPPVDDRMLGFDPPVFPAAVACDGVLGPGALAQASPGPAAHVIVTIAPGTACTIGAVDGVDAIVLVLEGQGSITPIEESSRYLKRWGALRVPGLGVRLIARSVGITLLLALASQADGALAPQLVAARPWTARPGPVEEGSFDGSPELVWGQQRFRARIAFGAPGSPRVGLTVLRFGGDATIPPHVHDSWEVLTVLAGTPRMRVAGQDAALGPGGSVAIPPNTQHEAGGVGEDVLVVQSYSPAGAEQRFVRLAADEAATTATTGR